MSALWVILGSWRLWLGGGIGAGFLKWAQLPVLVLLAFDASPVWWPFIINAIGLLVLARGFPHGYMLKYQGNPVRYLAFATARYIAPGVWWSTMLWYVGQPWPGPVVGSVVIVTSYFGFTLAIYRGVRLPTFTHPGDEGGNWAELVGWTGLGVALWLL